MVVKDMEKTKTIGKDYSTSELIRFAAPSVTNEIVISLLYTLDDGLFISRYIGHDALAAFSIGSPLFMLNFAIVNLLGGSAILVCAVIGALPHDEAARVRTFGMLLHAQFCFSESCGFSFGVDADDSFVLLQAMINPECTDEWHFVALMEKFVKTANVWGRRLNESTTAAADGGELSGTESDFAIPV